MSVDKRVLETAQNPEVKKLGAETFEGLPLFRMVAACETCQIAEDCVVHWYNEQTAREAYEKQYKKSHQHPIKLLVAEMPKGTPVHNMQRIPMPVFSK